MLKDIVGSEVCYNGVLRKILVTKRLEVTAVRVGENLYSSSNTAKMTN